MMNYKSQACEWTLNISLEHFKKNSTFLNFFIFLSYLIVPKNTSETQTIQFFSLEKCSKTPKPGQLKHFPSTEILYLFIIPNSAKKYNWNTYPSIFSKEFYLKPSLKYFRKL